MPGFRGLESELRRCRQRRWHCTVWWLTQCACCEIRTGAAVGGTGWYTQASSEATRIHCAFDFWIRFCLLWFPKPSALARFFLWSPASYSVTWIASYTSHCEALLGSVLPAMRPASLCTAVCWQRTWQLALPCSILGSPWVMGHRSHGGKKVSLRTNGPDQSFATMLYYSFVNLEGQRLGQWS